MASEAAAEAVSGSPALLPTGPSCSPQRTGSLPGALPSPCAQARRPCRRGSPTGPSHSPAAPGAARGSLSPATPGPARGRFKIAGARSTYTTDTPCMCSPAAAPGPARGPCSPAAALGPAQGRLCPAAARPALAQTDVDAGGFARAQLPSPTPCAQVGGHGVLRVDEETTAKKKRKSVDCTPETSKSQSLEISSKKKGKYGSSNSGASKRSKSGCNQPEALSVDFPGPIHQPGKAKSKKVTFKTKKKDLGKKEANKPKVILDSPAMATRSKTLQPASPAMSIRRSKRRLSL